MRIVFLGAPGSGKGTQAKLLTEKYGLMQISTGDLLRAAVAAGTELGKRAKAIMDAGELVSDEIVLGMIQEQLATAAATNGFILDGFPRNLLQAQALDDLLAARHLPLDTAIHLKVDAEEIVKRVTGRKSCPACGAIYNTFFSPPNDPDICNQCGHQGLQSRADDTETTVRKRLAVYQAQTAPLIDYYTEKGILQTVLGSGDVAAIFNKVCSVLSA